ncbi:EF-hand domain-containing protein [Novosphingobium sp. Gsoil 351]|uniref:EF-hand domain-containing protein n=1 Tax=Novosphingobium sp. Gsoil 351 TaxID=2675225 RepID=UPI0012B473C2|nr:EF-hand domain-containing protein [Novosphingobium sp. Gsoil 351]QGN54996.1 hypothetical protein GKE62_10945 [Novosphingobium sp. Gsoil 351]
MKKFTLAAAAATLAMSATALIAAPGDAKRGPDANGDGTITRAEVQAQVAERFAKADANGDGVLNEADKAARTGQMFDRIDTDKNGSISRAEFLAAHSGAGGEHAGMDHGAMFGPGGRPGGRMGGAGMMLRMADTNNDGAVTRDEALAAALKSFDRMDANKDGQVNRAERQAAMQAMGARMRGNGPGGDMPPPPAGDDQ